MSKRREVSPQSPQPDVKTVEKVVLNISMRPETWILAPVVTEDQLKRFHSLGWIDEEGLHLDRAFPRNSEGKPVILKLWLRAPMIRACRELSKRGEVDFEHCRKVVNSFSIVDENGRRLDYIVINDRPLRYRKVIGDTGKTMFFEYLDSTFTISFAVETEDPKTFINMLREAQYIGLMGGSSKGYGKFKVVSIEAKPIVK